MLRPDSTTNHTMKTYCVMIPMAGHVCLSVEAESEDDAKEKAFDVAGEALDRMIKSDDKSDAEFQNIELLDEFNRGNFCLCPSPWEVEVEESC
jgi:hypothetical protein